MDVESKGSGAGAAVAEPTESPSATPAAYRVSVEDSQCSFDVREGQAILDAALDQGVELAHGCRHGVCGACAVQVIEGAEALAPPDPIEADALHRYSMPHDVRLACRACTHGPLRITPA